jgi:hypothetical protein
MIAVLLAAVFAVPVPIGTGPLYHPAPAAHPVKGLACSRAETPRVGVHIELFANRRVVIVPAGIGIAPPLRRDGAYVLGGRCSYPVRTREPTGVVEVARGARLFLGDLFAVWNRPLSATRLVGFTGRVHAYVGGRPWRADVRAIPLTRHAQIVLEVGGHVPPHRSYTFRKGL